MISWMAARSDFPEYGEMLFYELPKDKLIYGPNQIEAIINQNTTISQQLTLWNQNGSRVIRGKQIVTPIENSFLTDASLSDRGGYELSAAQARYSDCRR